MCVRKTENHESFDHQMVGKSVCTIAYQQSRVSTYKRIISHTRMNQVNQQMQM